MSYITLLARGILKGAIAGWLAVIVTACFGFSVGLYAVSVGVSISSDFESTPMGLIALTSFLVVFWGIPASIGGMLVGAASQITTWFIRRSKAAVYVVASGLTVFTWGVLIANSSLPFQIVVLNPRTNVASALLLCVFVVATIGAAAWVARWTWSGNRPTTQF